ncbi:HAMP domain-containing sensor histidine kinase [Bifidobacterium pseudocatenulatum]|uniref:HAMP domain-containing sensor histidine kinase n=1 Tax=Bifidobacterium pseudocatenulatum TaxID=28026 RepID=UPI0018994B40|nr:HAMP domain-containing sensor histidine kinase [Bifidobacterium pseudocatenulatum]MDB6518842.1 HAMP domain-containing sensor histidine kinase [Bifidobacterium pseudocatenulatum]MDB6525870.1 HAMP domain-containing sensor histidine kinase [Bifidobacterium pseudocatenulatum]MDB6527035.1 HAMP domain-containing sensor histidine kinase [Bifidobacterium pseudocatenulatum]MDB6528839.1 HAMP domain-containing sensor histidine kinase [Bifidobacterium pseudocatenulatum]MDB6530932.1 HAMP domain-containi
MSQDTRQPSADPQNTQKNGGQPRPQRVPWHRRIGRKVQAIPLSTKLVTCIIVLLTIGTIGISFSIRTLVGNYLLQKTDTQLVNQAQMIFNSMDSLDSTTSEDGRSLVNTYYVEVRDSEYKRTGAGSVPMLREGVVSEPSLPSDGSIDGVTLGEPFTTQAVVHVTTSRVPDHAIMQAAQSPWRVVALPWSEKTKTGQVKDSGVVFIGLSLSDQIDTSNTLTRFCAMVGIAVVLIGAILGTIVVQSTLAPLKRIEKTAAKIAAGDLSQRVPDLPENTEVGSLSMSLNTMLTRIEEIFHAQEETTEKMERFVSDASHELRTPLAAIHGYAELYKMQRDMPGALERADESIEHIEASSARMTVLVEDLLSLARLDEGRGIDITQQVKLTSVVNDAADDLHALDPDRGITCGQVVLQAGSDMEHPSRLAFQPGTMPDITLTGDASRLRQVVTNIVGNIHRYTPADSPVEVSMGVLPASISPESLSRMPSNEQSLHHFIEAIEVGQSMQVGMNYAIVRFSDHGLGVPADARSKIFERFYTADPSRARQKGGTGLGMAIAQSVVKAHHGFICASGSDGTGLTLTVVLPVAPVEPRPLAQTSDERKVDKRGRRPKKQ